MTGRAEATDPACSLSPHHEELVATAAREAAAAAPEFIYRRPGNAARAGQLETVSPAD